jgi:hypothetical protein
MLSYTFLASTLYCLQVPQPWHWYASLNFTQTYENRISISIVYTWYMQGIYRHRTYTWNIHGIYRLYNISLIEVPDGAAAGRRLLGEPRLGAIQLLSLRLLRPSPGPSRHSSIESEHWKAAGPSGQAQELPARRPTGSPAHNLEAATSCYSPGRALT